MKKSILSIVLLLSVVLVSAKSNVNETLLPTKTVYSTSVNAFCKLIQMGDFETVKSLIKEGEDVNRKSNGLTPLMFAARHNKAKIAALLIENGAKLKLKSQRGITALKYAELSNAKDSYKVISEAISKNKKSKKRKK
ncbi:Ankyrin repeat-containing protein [Lutibacter oricola]|uniref:Ankyrin repeat-containing protein n=1 Tax=Lutibacter oricola TaxID=762486 RepID=A0A1H2T260_9FLAO|nr:ankyrin repeat domain-containing protein [Lutibacter oricola]SDW37951.1 Ankyrin repeat-containing protein [Lutibacter oricola]